jgi:hypothetical protein
VEDGKEPVKDLKNLGRPKLPVSTVLENQELADMAPDSTKDNSPRPDTWKPPLVSSEEHEQENPYSR